MSAQQIWGFIVVARVLKAFGMVHDLGEVGVSEVLVMMRTCSSISTTRCLRWLHSISRLGNRFCLYDQIVLTESVHGQGLPQIWISHNAVCLSACQSIWLFISPSLPRRSLRNRNMGRHKCATDNILWRQQTAQSLEAWARMLPAPLTLHLWIVAFQR